MQAKELRELTLYQNLQTVISRRRFRIYIPAMNVLYAVSAIFGHPEYLYDRMTAAREESNFFRE